MSRVRVGLVQSDWINRKFETHYTENKKKMFKRRFNEWKLTKQNQ